MKKAQFLKRLVKVYMELEHLSKCQIARGANGAGMDLRPLFEDMAAGARAAMTVVRNGEDFRDPHRPEA